MKDVQIGENVDLQRIEELIQNQRLHKPAMLGLRAKDRIDRIKRIKKAMFDYRERIQEAIFKDFKKPPIEVDITEIYVVTNEANDAIKNIKKWMRPQRVATPINMLGTTGQIKYEPKGNVLIISPWNYPINLVFGPLISAIAAGNTAIIKPSEYTPHTSILIEEIITSIFNENEVAVINGAIKTSSFLLKQRFDHIFFTGSPQVGKIVMKAAAEHLASVTLELGGKSPTIIDENANIKAAVKKITMGKFVNCGQTCISHDYIFVHHSKTDAFLKAFKSKIIAVFGEKAEVSTSYSRIINKKNTMRIASLIDEVKEKDADKIYHGGDYNIETCYVSPTLVLNPSKDYRIMKEEIFGPIIPIIEYEEIDEVIRYINNGEKPLVLYMFSKNTSNIRKVRDYTSSGSFNINETIIHYGNSKLPFGGSNNSGIGKAHGFFGFKAFSHEKGILQQHLPFSVVDLVMPPYTKKSKFWADVFLKYF
jgi:aldehyde dehydrogenase (NAD+)